MTREEALKLPFGANQKYAVGGTPNGELLLTGVKTVRGTKHLMAKIAGSTDRPARLDSFAKFQVPIEWYDKPRKVTGT